ncbi:MAG: DUF3052 domain-containing protein [Acidobacteriia bacterium]|nr:DUF3052 domain-containing protein [Terriglobia bacterium]
MGQEIKCRVDFGKESSRGKALLETSELIFRGDFRLKIPFQSITGLAASDGKLSIQFTGGSAILHLGDAAGKWAARIRNPPSRLDKLGVKPGMKVRLIGRHAEDFRRELAGRGAILSRSKPELIFLSIEEKDELVELAYVGDAPAWVIYPKGVERVTQNEVISAGRAAGLIDTKVCAFSATHTALRFKPRTKPQR